MGGLVTDRQAARMSSNRPSRSGGTGMAMSGSDSTTRNLGSSSTRMAFQNGSACSAVSGAVVIVG